MDESALQVMRVAFAFFSLLVLTAAVYDLWKFVIPNVVSVTVALLFFATVLLVSFPVDWLSHLGAAAAVLLVGMGVYHFGFLGAGDVKLLTAVSLWAGFEYLLDYLVVVALCGGGLTLGLWVLRRVLPGLLSYKWAPDNVKLPRVLLPQEQVPYGVAIALAAIYLAKGLPHLGGYLWA